MFTGLTTNMCLAFGAGALVGAGVGYWGASTYYRRSSRSQQVKQRREKIQELMKAGMN